MNEKETGVSIIKIHREIKKLHQFKLFLWHIFSVKNRSADILGIHILATRRFCPIVYIYFPHDSTAISTVCAKMYESLVN